MAGRGSSGVDWECGEGVTTAVRTVGESWECVFDGTSLADTEFDLDLLESFLGRERSHEIDPGVAELDISASDAETPPSREVWLGFTGNGDILRSFFGVCGSVTAERIGEASLGTKPSAEGDEMEWLLFRPNSLNPLPRRPLRLSILLSLALSTPDVVGLATSAEAGGTRGLFPNSSDELGRVLPEGGVFGEECV